MSDPQGLSPGDWLAAIVASILGGVGGMFAIFSSTKKDLNQRMATIEQHMTSYDEGHASHSIEIVVIQTCQENTRLTLIRLEEAVNKINDKLDKVLKP